MIELQFNRIQASGDIQATEGSIIISTGIDGQLKLHNAKLTAEKDDINVIGKDAHPFFNWAKKNHGKSAIPKWNFHKIIIGKDGKVADTFSSITKPSSQRFINSIEKEIKN